MSKNEPHTADNNLPHKNFFSPFLSQPAVYKAGVLAAVVVAVAGFSYLRVTAQNDHQQPSVVTSGEAAQPLDITVQQETKASPTDNQQTSPGSPVGGATLEVNGHEIPVPPNTTVQGTVNHVDGSTSQLNVSSTVSSEDSTNSDTNQTTRLRMKSSDSNATNSFDASVKIRTSSDSR